MTTIKPNPIILALDTATDACSVAVGKDQDIISRFVVQPQAHAKLLLSMVDEVCQTAGVLLRDVDLFAYGMGPGSFTGLRIAVGAIQGLAFAVDRPVLGVSSLHALAQQAPFAVQQTIVPIFDARMQEVYWGQYQFDSAHICYPVTADCLSSPQDLILAEHSIALGSGASAYAEILQKNNPTLQICSTPIYPRADEIVILARQRWQNGDLGVSAADALPMYIRNDVAHVGKKNPD